GVPLRHQPARQQQRRPSLSAEGRGGRGRAAQPARLSGDPVMIRWKTLDPLPLGLALGLLGAGALAMTLESLGADNVTYARAEWTARLSLVLAAPAIVLYVLPGALGPWWRAFWSAAMLAYLLHFWWAVFGVFQGDFGVIYDRQGFVALSNLLLTA